MEPEYYNFGQSFEIEGLTYPQAKNFVKAVLKHPYAKIIKGVKINQLEGVEFDLYPEIPSRPIFDIRKTERVCTLFSNNEKCQPNILSLRKDFPNNLLHLYLTLPNEPKSLCLFEQDWNELRLHITPEMLLMRIFSWFARAAIGEQHLDNQPLEPFLTTSSIVIYDPEIFAKDFIDQIYAVKLLAEKPRQIYRIEAISTKDTKKMPVPPCITALTIVTDKWHARIINQTPTSINDLAELLKPIGIDIISELQKKTLEIYDKNVSRIFMDYYWAILIRLPKTRVEGGQIETFEDWAFFVNETIGELGQKLGVIQKNNKLWARCLGENIYHDLDKSNIAVIKPVHALSREFALTLSGTPINKTHKICVIGAGAIGSHIVLNLARQGIGEWNIIDKDQILPHNHCRHALSINYECCNKAESLAAEVNLMMNSNKAAKYLIEDILNICSDEVRSKDIFENVDYIWDFSVSPAVSHILALLNFKAPRTSVFLLQSGLFMVIISEGANRKIRLDDLEAQLAITSIEDQKIKGLFASSTSTPIRYSGSCRDITTVLAQDIVATHSGIASTFLKKNMMNKSPTISVWRLEKNLSIRRFNIKPYRVKSTKINDWEIRISQHVLDLMKEYRLTKLPNETGGVLLGSINTLSRIIYIVGFLPSPIDSEEKSTSYIRGIKGLKKLIESIKNNTAGNIIYVGEWHSHPSGNSVNPSLDDIEALNCLTEQMSEEGYPAVMIIQGDKSEYKILIGNK